MEIDFFVILILIYSVINKLSDFISSENLG
jgi:hypothetical protein